MIVNEHTQTRSLSKDPDPLKSTSFAHLDLVSKKYFSERPKQRGPAAKLLCSSPDCRRPQYKNRYFQLLKLLSICKHHLANNVKRALRKEIKNAFRGSEKVSNLSHNRQAYGSFDFTGKGYITEDDFFSSSVLQRVPYEKEDIREFFKQNNLFVHGAGNSTIDFDTFKKTFFPQLAQIEDSGESEEEREVKQK